jgi:hypothetical protein
MSQSVPHGSSAALMLVALLDDAYDVPKSCVALAGLACKHGI